MQFKHPEILYILFALLIPVLIHLFQLQRFTKVKFTNVKFLKQIDLQTRKSSRLKKWLVLLSRLLAFAALIIAFAQPYFSKNDISKNWATSIYVDNSLSMSAKGEQGELLKRAIQNIAENLPDKGVFSLITNNSQSQNLSKSTLITQLKTLSYCSEQLALNTVLLKANESLENKKQHNVFLFSDFQKKSNIEIPKKTSFNYVKLEALEQDNISIDSVYKKEVNTMNVVVNVVVNNNGKKLENVILSASSNDIVLAKTALNLNENDRKTISLQFPKEHKEITIKLNNKDRFLFDNTYYISFLKKQKLDVMLIENKRSFLDKIYTKDEFNLTMNNPNQVAYEKIEKQALIVLNNIQSIGESLQTKLTDYVKSGGNLVVIPNKNVSINELNSFFNKLAIGQISKKINSSLKVTEIHYSHPVLNKVFEKQVSNFQYPTVHTHFSSMMQGGNAILSFENKQAFISQTASGKGNVYWVAAPLDQKSSDFTQTSLVVPVFYNIARQSNEQNRLSYRVGEKNSILVSHKMEKDAVLHISNETSSFIPLQQIKSDKVELLTKDNPTESGFYNVTTNTGKVIQHLAYNTNKSESNTEFVPIDIIAAKNDNIQAFNTIKDALSDLESEQNIQTYFKWFLILALLFLIIEILLLKFL